jgi:carbon-monoxide dehydrogenase small subunit
VGVDRIHGTALGIGERVGNVPLELLVLNLGLMGSKAPVARPDLRGYCESAARALGVKLPDTHPLFGRATSAADEPRASHDGAAEARAQATEPPARHSRLVPLELLVNGDRQELAVPPERTLLEVLRYDLDLYGTKQGCDKGDCGACTVRLDGRPHLSCLTLAASCHGRQVQTIEAMPGGDDLHPLLDAFDRLGAAQCGFCTPGFLMTAWALLDEHPAPSREQIREAISGNLCRCTGYRSIVDAIELAARMKRDEEPRMAGMPGREHMPLPIHTPKLGGADS